MDARRSLSEEPISAWLQMLERRRGPAVAPLLAFGLGSGLALLPFAFWSFITGMTWVSWLFGGEARDPLADPETYAIMLACLGGGAAFALFVLLLVVPIGQAALTARFLSSFRKARTLEEVVATPITPQRVVDALAVYGVRNTVRSLVAPVALCALLILAAGSDGPGFEMALVPLGWAGCWYYATLAGTAWERGGQRGGVGLAALLVGGLFVLLPALVVVAAFIVMCVAFGLGTAVALTAVACLPLSLIHRELAIQGVDENSALRRLVARWSTSSRRGHAYRSSTSNAMLFRERAARSGGLGQRLLRVHAPAVVAVAFACLLFQAEPDESAFLAVLPLLGLFAVLQALYASAMGLYHERQQGTLDLLQQSGLSVREYVNGCVRAASDRGMTDVLIGAGAAGVAVLLMGHVEDLGLLLGLTLVTLLAVEAASHWGTSMAADCRKRPQPAIVVLTFATAVGIALGLATTGGVLLLAVPLAIVADAAGLSGSLACLDSGFWFLLLMVAGLFGVRQVARISAMNTLRQRGDVIGFVD